MSIVTIVVLACRVFLFFFPIVIVSPCSFQDSSFADSQRNCQQWLHTFTRTHTGETAPCSSQKWCSCAECFTGLSRLFGLARFYFATAMDATYCGEDWPFSFWVLLAHLGTISCRRTLPDKSLARTLSLHCCFRLCDWTCCSAGFKVFFLHSCYFLFLFFTLRFHPCFHYA